VQEDIQIIDVQKSYDDHSVLKGINLTLKKGEVLGVIGASGSGKSTLLRMLIGLIKPSSGQIVIHGKNVENYTEDEWNELRISMGMVFQYSALFDSMTVGENVAFGLRQHTKQSEEDIRQKVTEMLSLVDLSDYYNFMPNELSGGMKKRVSLARALATDPQILLYDEPTAGLDPVMSDTINELMLRTKKRFNTTSVLVTHDMESAFMVADKIAMIHEGLIIEQGTPAEILQSKHPVVQKFVHRVMPLGGILNEV
jgi:ABC-type transport system involved in resistance to organic solvents, ATPase component